MVKKHSILGKLLRGGAVLAMSALVLPTIPALTADAAEYELYICGTKVTDTNKRDILKDSGFSYNSTSKTLTVKSDSTEYDYGPVIESYIEGLTIKVDYEDVDLYSNCSERSCIELNADTTILGNGDESDSLIWITGEEGGIFIVNGDLTVRNMGYLGAYSNSSTGYAISASGDSEKLTIDNSTIRAKNEDSSNQHDAIDYFAGGITLQECMPDNGLEIRSGGVRKTDGSPAKSIYINRIGTEICGQRVTAANQADVLGNGVFSYDPASNTLTVSGDYTYDPEGTPADYLIFSNLPGLTVNIAADSELLDMSSYAEIEFGADTTFTGSGKLTLNRELELYADAVIRDLDITIDTDDYSGIYCTGDLTLENARLDLSADGRALYAKSVNTDDLMVVSEGRFYTGGSWVYTAEEDTTNEIPDAVIIPKYKLEIKGAVDTKKNYVNADNCTDILGDGGSLTYDPAGKVLNINSDLTIEDDQNTFIESYIDGLTVKVNGSRTWSVVCSELFWFNADTTITGDSLTWSCINDNNENAIYQSTHASTTLTIKNVTLNLTSRLTTICASHNDKHLVIMACADCS